MTQILRASEAQPKGGVLLSEALRPRLTADGIRALLADLRAAGKAMPRAILVSEYDRRDLNQDLMAGSVAPVSKDDQKPEADGYSIGIIEGVVIKAHPHISRGNARLVYEG